MGNTVLISATAWAKRQPQSNFDTRSEGTELWAQDFKGATKEDLYNYKPLPINSDHTQAKLFMAHDLHSKTKIVLLLLLNATLERAATLSSEL